MCQNLMSWEKHQVVEKGGKKDTTSSFSGGGGRIGGKCRRG